MAARDTSVDRDGLDSTTDGLGLAVEKMRAADVPDPAITAFRRGYQRLVDGDTGVMAEDDLEPVTELPRASDLDVSESQGADALTALVVIKLNGGLGTSMGMDRAKSLLEVHDGITFLDVIVRQVLALRRLYGGDLPLILMDSFRTQDDSLAALRQYPDLAVDGLPADFLQNREPKLLATDLSPVQWPADPTLEWCPPGHGDLYAALVGSGLLDRLLVAGKRYAFVSNSDNLGARPDPRLAGWFAGSGAPFAAEYCRRTAADRKGGHVARRIADGRLILRETAQTRPEDMAAFTDVDRHPFFHTNNLWLNLPALAETLAANGGVLDLPIIRNVKTVDPSDPATSEVIQLETAMGSAIGVFDGAEAIEVERNRFLPVKTTSDLLVLRSDAYQLTDEAELRLAADRIGAPLVDLDKPYKVISDFDARFPSGPPSLIEAESLTVAGDWTFGGRVVVRGRVQVGEPGSRGRIGDGTVLQ